MSHETVLLFPGQGAYLPGALTGLTLEVPDVASTFAEVDAVASAAGLASVSDAVTGDHTPQLERLLLDEPPHILQLTLYATAVGIYRALVERGVRADVLAGHSLGEISALVCGGAFTIAQGAEIVLRRTEAVGETNPGGVMVALGAHSARVQQILDLLGDATTVIAAENSPRQTVVSGSDAAVEAVEAVARALRISAVQLRSPFPFHNPLLAAASARLSRELATVPQQPLTVPVYSPILGRYYTDDDRLADALAAHLTSRVSFTTALAALRDAGAGVFVEAAVGTTLTRLVADSVSDVESIACVDGAGNAVEAFHRACSALTKLGVMQRDPIQDVAALLLPDLDEARRRSFWVAHADDVHAHVRALLLDHEATRNEQGAQAAGPAPATAPDPVASSPSGRAAVTPSRVELFAELSGMYATALEYPAEVFTEDVQLEADLGVDSVKQTELLSRAADLYQLPTRPADFRLSDYSTMGKVADFVFSGLTDAAA